MPIYALVEDFGLDTYHEKYLEHLIRKSSNSPSSSFLWIRDKKPGSAPLHSWLPDAHTQAPAPVSAMVFGVHAQFRHCTASCAICRLPTPPLAVRSGHIAFCSYSEFSQFSLQQSSSLFAEDLKRLLAYSSVEHVGIIALGLWTWPASGPFAAAPSTHSFTPCASRSAFSAQADRPRSMGLTNEEKITGALATNRVWGLRLNWEAYSDLFGGRPIFNLP